MILTILKIRFIQAIRLIKLIGLIRALILFVLVGFVSLMVFNYLKNANNSMIASILAGLAILSIHASRKDKRFLKINFKYSYLIFLIEYFIIVLPLLIICFFFKEWNNVLILLLACLLIPRIYLNLGTGNISSVLNLMLAPFRRNLNFKINIKIPIRDPRAFELICGFRRFFIVIIPVYLIILGFSFKGYVALIGMLILSIFISGFYFYGESREFIELFSSNYRTFILQKITLNLKYLSILFAPIVIIAVISQPETWYFIIGAVIISAIIQIITIIIKYALFIENADLGHNGILVFFNIICILLPFLWPLPVIMCIRYYNKAKNKLKIYTNDIN